MNPNAMWHAIDATTHSAGRPRRKRTHGWAWSAVLLGAALVALVWL